MTARPKLLTTTPSFIVADLKASLDFYCGKLGFGEPGVWGEPPCFAMIHRDGFEMMLSLAEEKARPRPNGPDGMWDMYIRVGDLDAEIAALKAAGAEIASGPETKEYYGMREIELLDPDGHRICFGQDVET
jgi:catechol 2,3-dioxygenase-like lactoylglutathione lyase family enzyme